MGSVVPIPVDRGRSIDAMRPMDGSLEQFDDQGYGGPTDVLQCRCLLMATTITNRSGGLALQQYRLPRRFRYAAHRRRGF